MKAMTMNKAMNGLRQLILTGGAILVGGLLLTAQAQTTGSGQTATGRANRAGQTPNTGKVGAMLMPAMDRMLEQMKAAPKTGNPDRDYATLVKIHHQAVLELAQQGMQKSKNTGLVSLVKDQAAQKESELAQINKLLPQLASTPANLGFSQELSQKLQAITMNTQNDMNGTLTGDFDKDFLQAMIQHNQDDVDLAQTYLKYAQDSALRTEAEQIRANSQKAIDLLKQQIR